jgi:hypothetical protein
MNNTNADEIGGFRKTVRNIPRKPQDGNTPNKKSVKSNRRKPAHSQE